MLRRFLMERPLLLPPRRLLLVVARGEHRLEAKGSVEGSLVWEGIWGSSDRGKPGGHKKIKPYLQCDAICRRAFFGCCHVFFSITSVGTFFLFGSRPQMHARVSTFSTS